MSSIGYKSKDDQELNKIITRLNQIVQVIEGDIKKLNESIVTVGTRINNNKTEVQSLSARISALEQKEG
jgi:peptidoglycan hydrolase CwlO-like protein